MYSIIWTILLIEVAYCVSIIYCILREFLFKYLFYHAYTTTKHWIFYDQLKQSSVGEISAESSTSKVAQSFKSIPVYTLNAKGLQLKVNILIFKE